MRKVWKFFVSMGPMNEPLIDPRIWLEVRRYDLLGECECDVILHVGDKEYDEDVLDRVLNDEVVRKRILEILGEVNLRGEDN